MREDSTRRLKLAVFCAYYPPHVGGFERNVHELCKRMVLRGHDVVVVAGTSLPLCGQRILDGVRVLDVPCWDLLGGTYPVPKPSIMFVRTWRSLVQMKPDVVNTQTRFFVMSLLGALLSQRLGARFIHTERGTSHSVVSSRFVRWLAAAYDHTVGSLVVRSASMCVGVSRAAADFCGHLGARRAIVIPNGITVSEPDPAEVWRVRCELVVNSGLLFCYVGRLVHGKGVHDLLNAFAGVKVALPGSKLLLVGNGPDEAMLRVMCSSLGLDEDVVFAGEVPHDEAMVLLAAADVFVNPSYTEGLPTTVLEAAALGRAILATDVGGTREIIEHGVSGYLVCPGVVEELADGMIALGRDAKARARLGGQARQVSLQFDWSRVTGAWEDLLFGSGRGIGEGSPFDV